mmetsp:Transcript_86303/g.175346  ORF Transcript_86303/g.175346 Transcript_86303/m.175346 type:complete len:384 (-) Transcript_86303:14-1165(-)
MGVALQSQRHDDFFEGRVSGTLTDSVDGALQLAGSVLRTGQGVGGGQPEIVLAMRAEDDLVGSLDVLAQGCDEVPELPGHVPSGGVGDVEGGGTDLDHLRKNPVEKLGIGTTGVLGRKFDVVATQALRERDGVDRDLDNFVGGFVEFCFHVNRAGGNKRVDSGQLGSLHGVPRPLDVLGVSSRQAANDRNVSVIEFLVSDDVRDLLHGGEIVRGSNGKAGLDDVHAELCEHAGNLEFFIRREGRTRALFPVAEGGVKDPNVIGVRDLPRNVLGTRSADLGDLFGRGAEGSRCGARALGLVTIRKACCRRNIGRPNGASGQGTGHRGEGRAWCRSTSREEGNEGTRSRDLHCIQRLRSELVCVCVCVWGVGGRRRQKNSEETSN